MLGEKTTCLARQSVADSRRTVALELLLRTERSLNDHTRKQATNTKSVHQTVAKAINKLNNLIYALQRF